MRHLTGSKSLEKSALVALSFFVIAFSGCGGTVSENKATSLVNERKAMIQKIVEDAKQAPCVPADQQKQADNFARESVMTLLAYPRQSGAYFEPQILGKARLEIFKVEGEDKQVFLSLPPADSSGEPLAQAICRVAVNKSLVEVSKDIEDGKAFFKDYSFKITPEKAAFFRTPLANLRIDSDLPLKFPFSQATYAPKIEELHFLTRNEGIYGGKLEAQADAQSYGQATLYNYGTFVVKQGEASFQRFVGELTKDLGSREQKVQRLADLVSREIAPSPEEVSQKVFKRANEVLMTGQGAYPAQAVLLGSLLEQLQEDYLLIYSKNFLAVAVKQGQFPADNKFQVRYEGSPWLLIDTSTPGWRIGLDAPKMKLGTVAYVQRPRQINVITNLNTGGALPFNQ
jgi:hypothetical protein